VDEDPMTTYPIRIRIGSPQNGDFDTKTYIDSTFAEAVAALQGTHTPENGYHRDVSVYVVATYPVDTVVPPASNRHREVTYKAGDPVFGFQAQVYGRRIAYTDVQDAQPSWSSMGSCSVEEAELQSSLIQLAIQLAKAANCEPFCADCRIEMQQRSDRVARLGTEMR
jgi:hypothetical protein